MHSEQHRRDTSFIQHTHTHTQAPILDNPHKQQAETHLASALLLINS